MMRTALGNVAAIQLYGMIGLLFFIGVFGVVTVATCCRPRRAFYQHLAALPLTEEQPCPTTPR